MARLVQLSSLPPLIPEHGVFGESLNQFDLMTDLLGTPSKETISLIRNDKARGYLSSMRRKQPIPFPEKIPNADPSALKLLQIDQLLKSHLDREKKVCKFFESKNLFWIELLDDIVKTGNHSSNQVSEKEVAILWGSICCYPNIKDVPEDSLSMLNKLICNLDRLLHVEEENISGLAKTTWTSLLGATLSSYHELLLVNVSTSSELGLFLSLAKRHSTCPQVLSSVAEYLDSLHGAASLGITGQFDPQKLLDLLRIFGVNLSSPDKHVRVLTLRILSYFTKMDQRLGSHEEQPHKRQRTEDSRDETVDAKYTNIPACSVCRSSGLLYYRKYQSRRQPRPMNTGLL